MTPTASRSAGSANATSAATAPTTDKRLEDLIARAWQHHLRTNPVGASLNGYHRFDDRWGDPSLAQERRATAQIRAFYETLQSIDPDKLSPAAQLNYRLLAYRFRDALAQAEHPAAVQSLITQLWGPQLMGGLAKRLRFKTLADYRNWLERMESFGAYLDAFTRRLRRAVSHGFTQPRVVMQRVVGEIKGAISESPTESVFYYPFRHMPPAIPDAKRADLRARAKAAIKNVINPAYREFLAFFKNVYLPNARTNISVSSLPGGRAYYRYLVRHYTTTDMTPAEVHELGLKLVAQIHERMAAIFETIGFEGSYQAFLHYLRTDPRFYYSDPDHLLMAYRAATKRVDPNLVEIVGTWLLPRVPYGVRPIPEALAPNTYPAYSVPPAGDGSVAGYVGVNLYKPETRPKYAIQVLMCHEGRPGHQLQVPVANRLHNLPPFRRFAYYNAYGEGWALYAETLCAKLGLYDTPYEKFGYLNYQMWRAVRLVVDTGIHWYGWSRAKAINYMQEHTALANQNIRTEVDRYIVWPGQALSYMIGERTILALREEAKARLGEKYSLRAFNNVVLGQGSLPMKVLTDVVHRWIERTLSGMPVYQLPYASKPRSLR